MENELVTKEQVIKAIIAKVEPEVISIINHLPSADANKAEYRKGYGKGYMRAVYHERRHCKRHPDQYVEMCKEWDDETD